MVFKYAQPRCSREEKDQLIADAAESWAFQTPEEPWLTDQPAEPEEKVQAALHQDDRAERLPQLQVTIQAIALEIVGEGEQRIIRSRRYHRKELLSV